MTLATCRDNRPWCCNCFYAYLEQFNGLAFASDSSTRHIIEALQQPYVAGSIVLETKIIGKLQGVQLEGKIVEAESDFLNEIGTAYFKRFPYAKLMDTKLWFLELHTIKFTDNSLGFGKKIYWSKPIAG